LIFNGNVSFWFLILLFYFVVCVGEIKRDGVISNEFFTA
jgi:hypothetical protein